MTINRFRKSERKGRGRALALRLAKSRQRSEEIDQLLLGCDVAVASSIVPASGRCGSGSRSFGPRTNTGRHGTCDGNARRRGARRRRSAMGSRCFRVSGNGLHLFSRSGLGRSCSGPLPADGELANAGRCETFEETLGHVERPAGTGRTFVHHRRGRRVTHPSDNELLAAICSTIVLAGVQSDDVVARRAPLPARPQTIDEIGALAVEPLFQCGFTVVSG